MRRTLTIMLLLVFGLPVAAPALGLAADATSSLPACCRRNGAHHCQMSQAERDAITRGTQLGSLHAHCPAYPTVPITTAHLHLFANISNLRTTLLFAEQTGVPQTEACARVSRSRSHQKRGPPILLN